MVQRSLMTALQGLVVALLPALPVLAADSVPAAAAPGTFVSGVHSPATHLLEVSNGAVLRAAVVDSRNGTLAERAETHVRAADRPVTTALSTK
jgi:hypothetical protein